MRVRDVMSSPVITVPPDMRLKEVAELLVTRGISAVPVVADGQLVGIVSEADLVPLELAPDPRAHLAPPADPPAGLPRVAAEAMTRAVVALYEDADTAEAGRPDQSTAGHAAGPRRARGRRGLARRGVRP